MRKNSLVCLLTLGTLLSWALVPAADFYVIPVRKCCACKGTLVGTRWCNNGDGTVTDLTTCLVWLKYANWGGQKPWRSNTPGDYDDAHTRAGLLAQDTKIWDDGLKPVFLDDGSVVGDWRLPTKTELVGIRSGIEPVSSAQPRAFNFVLPDDYWSSTSNANPIWAWLVHFTDENVNMAEYTLKGNSNYVWPVRGGQ